MSLNDAAKQERRALHAGIGLLMLGALSACTDPISTATQPTGPELPPIGLQATARWLEEREATTPAAARALQPAAPAPASAPVRRVAAPVPVTGSTPTITLAARAFADVCVASLPSMADVDAKLIQISQRDFGKVPSSVGDAILITGQQPGNIQMETAINAGRSGVNQCLISVRRQDPQATASALVNTVTSAGYTLRATSSANAAQTWDIVGAPAGTQLKVNTRRNALGQSLTGAWITWR